MPGSRGTGHILRLNLDFQLGNYGGTAAAQTLFVGAVGMHPAAGALDALGFADTDGQCGIVDTGTNFCALFSNVPSAGRHNAHLSQVHTLAGGLRAASSVARVT